MKFEAEVLIIDLCRAVGGTREFDICQRIELVERARDYLLRQARLHREREQRQGPELQVIPGGKERNRVY